MKQLWLNSFVTLVALCGLLVNSQAQEEAPAPPEYVSVEPTDIEDLKAENFEQVLARINSKNSFTKGNPDHLTDQLKRSLLFASQARQVDRTAGIEYFAKWVSVESETEIVRLKGSVADENLSDSYFALAKLNATIVRDQNEARRFYLEGLKPWIEKLSEKSSANELKTQLELLEGEPKAALLKYLRLLRTFEHQERVHQGLELQRALEAQTAETEQ